MRDTPSVGVSRGKSGTLTPPRVEERAEPVSLPPSFLLETRFSSGDNGFDLGHWIKPLRRNYRIVALGALIGAILTLVGVFAYGRHYEARMTLAAVGNPKLAALEGGLATSLLGSGLGMGLNATPALIVQLAQLDGVLYPVAESKIDSVGRERIIDRLVGKQHASLDPADVVKKMRKVVWLSYDRQTGLITLEVVHKDSALARLIAERLLTTTSSAFVRAARAQATELRRAQEARVDSAERRLRSAEERLVEFNRQNRSISDFSPAYLDRQRLERDASISRTVYTQAVTDREAAVAKELEATPSVIVVDPVPDRLPAAPRYLALLLCVGIIMGALSASLIVILRLPRRPAHA